MAVVIFFILAAGALVFAANVVFRRNPAICAVNLVGVFFCLAGIYLLIGFPFLAALQLMVYAGAIMVLFVFVIMLLDLRQEEPRDTPMATMLAPLFAAVIVALLVTVLGDIKVSTRNLPTRAMGQTAAEGGKGLATALFSKNLLAFEATSLLLLVGILGVVLLAKRRHRASENLDAVLAAAKRPSDTGDASTAPSVIAEPTPEPDPDVVTTGGGTA